MEPIWLWFLKAKFDQHWYRTFSILIWFSILIEQHNCFTNCGNKFQSIIVNTIAILSFQIESSKFKFSIRYIPSLKTSITFDPISSVCASQRYQH
ncbi:hypothetical protein BLOT_004396 [Blomia tropicalis]|nr:hypothetical protein BLOT_004396 [Blomia tropicalis]